MSNNERWKPGYSEAYYYVDSDLSVVAEYWDGDSYMDKSHYGNYNCFKTEAEAKVVAEKFKKLLKTIHDRSEQPTKVEHLLKLTTEVFDRPDCPKWAKFAVVDADGTAMCYGKRPIFNIHNNKWYPDCTDCCNQIIEGEYDSSDWQNSLIERPTKLPEWCKVGEWCYGLDIYGKGKYFKIIKIQNNYVYGDECCVKSLFVSQARIRPYNSDEMRSLIGKVIEHDNLFILVTYYDGRDNDITLNGYVADAKRLLNEGFTIDGKPCGVLEHLNEDGEWVE